MKLGHEAVPFFAQWGSQYVVFWWIYRNLIQLRLQWPIFNIYIVLSLTRSLLHAYFHRIYSKFCGSNPEKVRGQLATVCLCLWEYYRRWSPVSLFMNQQKEPVCHLMYTMVHRPVT